MIQQQQPSEQKGLRAWLSAKRKAGKTGMLAIIIFSFLIGYTATSSYRQYCQAQSIPQIATFAVQAIQLGCRTTCNPVCTTIGVTQIIQVLMSAALKAVYNAAMDFIEQFISFGVDTVVENILRRQDRMEGDMVDWWQTFWHYNLRPGMQLMTDQRNASTSTQTMALGQAIDTEQQAQTISHHQRGELASIRAAAPHESGCPVATVAGGLGRQAAIARGMRRGWQDESAAVGLNKQGTPDANGPGATIGRLADEFEQTFCDPEDNNGQNTCNGSTPEYYNADVQVLARFYNPRTIPVERDPREALTLEHILNNMVGSSKAEGIHPDTMEGPTGQEIWLDRRSYLARRNALRSVPQLMASWRMPGSDMGPWLRQMRSAAGIALDELLNNSPSYKEIMQALTVDRFNDGSYGMRMSISNREQRQQEKLLLTAFQLMQLRDYYELLERTALVLSTQVSVMVDQYPLEDMNNVRPTRP